MASANVQLSASHLPKAPPFLHSLLQRSTCTMSYQLPKTPHMQRLDCLLENKNSHDPGLSDTFKRRPRMTSANGQLSTSHSRKTQLSCFPRCERTFVEWHFSLYLPTRAKDVAAYWSMRIAMILIRPTLSKYCHSWLEQTHNCPHLNVKVRRSFLSCSKHTAYNIVSTSSRE